MFEVADVAQEHFQEGSSGADSGKEELAAAGAFEGRRSTSRLSCVIVADEARGLALAKRTVEIDAAVVP